MYLFRWFLVVSFVAAQSKIFDAALISESREGRSWRLPNTSYPLKYHLHIITWIHQEIFNFTGNATIELMITENASKLVLHAKDLHIQEIYIQDLTTQEKIESLSQRTIDDLLIIYQLKRDNNWSRVEPNIFLHNHRLRLELHYTGIINNKQEGFSTLTYQDDSNKTIYGAYTQMEPFSARTVLPCYDEPGLKANFTVSITHGNNYTAISNMPAAETIAISFRGNNNMTTTSFMETPPMSTYLLGFAVMNYKYIAREENGLLQRAFLPPNSLNRGDLILTNAFNAVQTFARYMNVSYPLPKLDHIGIKQLKFSGMENWGLITYMDKNLVSYNNTDMSDHIQQIHLQNHEIIHQWFGNLVSPAWWDSLWLKEGFAEYYASVLTNMSNPEYTPLDWFTLNTCFTDELYDNLIPIADYVENPDDIEKKYYFAVYYKAPCIIQMFEHAFGEPIFRKAVSNYLKSHAFSSATEDKLFDHIQSALLESSFGSWKYSTLEIMKPWFHAQTLPKVNIIRDYNNSNIIHIRQYSSRKNITELWWIPLNFATTKQPNFESTTAIYYMPPVPEVTLNLTELNLTLNTNDWLLANIKSTSFYRVYYDIENLKNIANTLQKNHSVINMHNRAIILRSISNMWTEELSLVTALELLKYLPEERDNFVWCAIFKVLHDIQKALYYTTSYELFNDFMRNNVRSQYLKYYGKISDKFDRLETCGLALIACRMDMSECLHRSKELYMAQKENIFSGDTKLTPYTICDAAKIFNSTEFKIALKYLMTEPAELRIYYWQYLRCTEIEALYVKLLQASLNAFVSGGKRQSVLYFWADLLETANVMQWNLTYKFLYKQMPELQIFSNATFELCLAIKSKAQTIRKPFHAKYIELMNLCSKQLLMKSVIRNSSEIMPSFSQIGENFSFEDHPQWLEEVQKVYVWLKQLSRLLIKI